jgi:hypothetical protein
MDLFVRSIASGIGDFFTNALATVGGALHELSDRLAAIVPGGAAGALVAVVVVGLLAWNVLRR